jgi:hypothetical protein
MSRDFADWYQSVTFGHDRGVQTVREESAKIAAESLADDISLELVKLVFGGPTRTEKIDDFRKFFKDKDPSFKMSGNDQELLALAGWVLAEICSNTYSSPVTTAILTTAMGGARKPSIDMDLVGIARYEIIRDGDNERKRPDIILPTAFDKITFADHSEIEEAEEAELDTNELKDVITSILAQLDEKQNEYIKFSEDLYKIVSIQDEELQTLWWLIGGWSDRWEALFEDIDMKSRPILLANELATLSKASVEPRSLKSLFSRVKIGEIPITIPEAIGACGGSRISILSSKYAPCPVITPVQFAISRAAEIGGDADWVAPWQKVCGISPEYSLPAIDLAIQCFRENKLLEQLSSSEKG